MSSTPPAVDEQLRSFNDLDDPAATELLLACCAAPSWASTLNAGRPWPDRDTLLAAADRAAGELDAPGVEAALAAHPRIGERPAGQESESRWSRSEQGGVERDESTLRRLADGNRAYEERFDRVFLICATGLDAGAILAALEQRLHHDPQTEWCVVRDELRKIAVLRLGKALSS